MLIDFRNDVIYRQIRYKYKPVFYKIPDDLLNIIMQFIGYDDIFDITDDSDYDSDGLDVYIPKKEYRRIKPQKNFRGQLYNIKPIGWRKKNELNLK
jgi:hypothetical protein